MKEVEESLAMHNYITGTSFQRIEEEHLLEAFQICRINIKLANYMMLSNDLLLLSVCEERR